MIKKLILALAVVAIIPLVAIGCGSLPKSAVAEVNGKVITREDLDSKIADIKAQYGNQAGIPQQGTPEYTDFEKQVTEELVNEEVMWFEADKRGLDVSNADINKEVDQIKQSAGGEQQFQQALNQQNMTLDHLKDNIRKGLLYQKLLAAVTKNQPAVTDAQAQNYYNQHKADQTFQKPETRKVREIVVANLATAQKVKSQLNAGADFATLAKQYSTDTTTKNNGGDLGEIPSQQSGLPAAVEQAMDKLSAGQTSDPIKSTDGYHIIRVDQIIPPGVAPFSQVESEIKSQLAQDNQQQAFMTWLNKTKKNYDIKYSDEFNPYKTAPATGSSKPASTAPAGTSTAAGH